MIALHAIHFPPFAWIKCSENDSYLRFPGMVENLPGKWKLLAKFSLEIFEAERGTALRWLHLYSNIEFVDCYGLFALALTLSVSVLRVSSCYSLTVNNHKFHSFPCALFTIQLQHRLHCNKWTIYISRFRCYELCFHCVYTKPLSFTDGCCCERNNIFHFGMFSVCVCVGVCIVIFAISTTENAVPESQRLTIKLDKCQAEFSTVNDQNWNKTITMHETTM